MQNDLRGNWVSQKPFKNGSPVTYERPFCLNGYHEIRRTFNARNKVERIEYFSTGAAAAECTDICNTKASFHRVDFIYEDGKLVKQELYKSAGGAIDKTLDCNTGYCIAPAGLNSTMGGR
jgi:hypothetical protein